MLWEDGAHIEVPVGTAGAALGLISVGRERTSDLGPGSKVLRRQRQQPPPWAAPKPLPQANTERTHWVAAVTRQCAPQWPPQLSLVATVLHIIKPRRALPLNNTHNDGNRQEA